MKSPTNVIRIASSDDGQSIAYVTGPVTIEQVLSTLQGDGYTLVDVEDIQETLRDDRGIDTLCSERCQSDSYTIVHIEEEGSSFVISAFDENGQGRLTTTTKRPTDTFEENWFMLIS